MIPSLDKIRNYFKREYNFSISRSSAIKYCVKNINIDYFKPIDFNMNFKAIIPEESISVDEETVNLFNTFYQAKSNIQYRKSDILSAIVLHFSKLLK